MQHQFEDLKVWQKSMALTTSVYQATKSFPKEELFGLTSQIQRASVSIPVNIAEGTGRQHTKDYLQFLHIARGSVYELLTLLKIASNLGYLTPSQLEILLKPTEEVIAMLSGLIRSLK